MPMMPIATAHEITSPKICMEVLPCLAVASQASSAHPHDIARLRKRLLPASAAKLSPGLGCIAFSTAPAPVGCCRRTVPTVKGRIAPDLHDKRALAMACIANDDCSKNAP